MSEAIYAAIRVQSLDDPLVPSVERDCADCGEKCWCDYALLRLVDQVEPDLEIVCEVCLLGRVAGVSRS